MKTIKERAKELILRWNAAEGESAQSYVGYDMATFLYEIANAPSVPVLTVECEPDYWSGGHYHEGTMPHIDPTAVWKLPIGTELYTSPPANNQSEQHLEMVNAPAPSVTDGRKMVPDEPTAEMREAGHRAAWRRIPSLFDEDDAANVYRSMLAAAPAAPERDPAVTEAFFLGDENLDAEIDAALAAEKGGAP